MSTDTPSVVAAPKELHSVHSGVQEVTQGGWPEVTYRPEAIEGVRAAALGGIRVSPFLGQLERSS